MNVSLVGYLRLLPRAGRRAVLAGATGLALAGCQDQPTMQSSDGGEDAIIDFELTPEGAAAAGSAKMIGSHKLPTVSGRHASMFKLSASVGSPGSTDNSPFDLTYFGGPVVTQATSYAVYVNCAAPATPASCWGDGGIMGPALFLNDLNASNYLQIVNQYIGTDAKGKFPARQMKTKVILAKPHTATLEQIFNIVFDAVTATGASGYGAIYHVFLPQGTDMCIDPNNCYSPDNPDTWLFCAFHGSVDFGDAGHVLFTVEPFQGVDGCQLPGQTPHGLIDATASTLSHELIETITDPDLNAWFNALFGFEMSDVCSAFGSNEVLNGRNYFIQLEYSNALHLCSDHLPQEV